MKKKFFIVLVGLLFICSGCAKKEKTALKIDGIEITASEFNKAFQSSALMGLKTSGKKEFLDLYISRKLILKEAEKAGLDKTPEFLQQIQLFWEQSLLRIMLAKKINELSLELKVTDQEVKDYYGKQKQALYQDRPLSEVGEQIRLSLLRLKQTRALEKWSASLKDKSKITVDYKLLGIDK
jgi:hypothetical protein